MNIKTFALGKENYTFKNVISWGLCYEHGSKGFSSKLPLWKKAVHFTIALIESIPIISQIASLFEMVIMKVAYQLSQDPLPQTSLQTRSITAIPSGKQSPESELVETGTSGPLKSAAGRLNTLTAPLFGAPVGTPSSGANSLITPTIEVTQEFRSAPTTTPLPESSSTRQTSQPPPSNSCGLASSASLVLQPDSEDQEISTAIRIQSIWRGHLAKVQVGKERRQVLSYALFEKAKPYIDHRESLESLPRAVNGATPVYLPPELPIVFKQSGSPDNQKRFDKMKTARSICEKSNYTRLTIPKARVYNEFIIETKLPITMHRVVEQIGLYVENLDRFTDAVKEFTGFLCQASLRDILGSWDTEYYASLAEVPVRRYDNIPLYLEEEQGKIALIDLEELWSLEEYYCTKNIPISHHVRKACENAVSLFPFHFEEIISTAQKFDPTIDEHRPILEEKRAEGLRFCRIVHP